MGFFDFLKKKKVEEETIRFKDVNSWIDNYIESKNLDEKRKEFKSEIKTKTKETKELLEKLDKAGLMNENIPERVKQIMAGNRKNYLRKITQFVDQIEIPNDYMKIPVFSKEFSQSLDDLSKDTQKNFMVLREFLETELAAVVRKVKEIEILATDTTNQLKEDKLDEIEEIKTLLKNYRDSKDTGQSLKESKKKQEKEFCALNERKERITKRIESLKKGSAFKEYNKLNEAKEKVASDTLEEKKDIIHHFSTLEKAMKKYARISLNEKLINAYLSDPIKALIEDNQLEIITLLSKMSVSLPELGLKDKKEEKTKEEIKLLGKEFLNTKRKNLKNISEREKEVNNKLLSNTSVMNIKEQESLLESTERKIKEKETELEETSHKIKRNNPKEIKKQVGKELEEFNVILENG